MLELKILNFIFSSTAAVYGEPQNIPITEDEKISPVNPYGNTKAVIEKILKDYDKAYGFRYISLRYFNACGAHIDGSIGERHKPETHLIPLILQTASGRRENFTIYGDDYDTKDGTYTVTNIGNFGSIMGTPIINQPQVGILAIGSIEKKPSVIETNKGDFIGVRRKMILSHSYDHRIINGATGGLFIKRLKEILESWDSNTMI